MKKTVFRNFKVDLIINDTLTTFYGNSNEVRQNFKNTLKPLLRELYLADSKKYYEKITRKLNLCLYRAKHLKKPILEEGSLPGSGQKYFINAFCTAISKDYSLVRFNNHNENVLEKRKVQVSGIQNLRKTVESLKYIAILKLNKITLTKEFQRAAIACLANRLNPERTTLFNDKVFYHVPKVFTVSLKGIVFECDLERSGFAHQASHSFVTKITKVNGHLISRQISENKEGLLNEIQKLKTILATLEVFDEFSLNNLFSQ